MASLTVCEFPVDLLDGCETALVVFAAAFGGVQDAAYIRDAGLHGTCVDIAPAALEAMRVNYPDDWTYLACDAFSMLAEFPPSPSPLYDLVSLDPWNGPLMERTHAELHRFAALARRLLIVGSNGHLDPPDGWQIARHDWRSPRNGGTYWTSLVPA